MKTLNVVALICAACGINLFGQNPLFIPDTLSGTVINLNLQHGNIQFFPGNPTQTLGANGNILAPTLFLDRGQQVTINVTNLLSDSTTLHWHGMHVAPHNDGGPHTPILPGQTWSPSFQVLDHIDFQPVLKKLSTHPVVVLYMTSPSAGATMPFRSAVVSLGSKSPA